MEPPFSAFLDARLPLLLDEYLCFKDSIISNFNHNSISARLGEPPLHLDG
jgi:hypothetical protein